MNFSTYGPFTLKGMSSTHVDNLFAEIQSQGEDLQYGIGVYIVATRAKNGRLMPWYVGKTCSQFGRRLVQHIKDEKFNNLVARIGPIQLLLIAHVTGSGKKKKVTEKIRHRSAKKFIDRLEFTLIGSCLLVNPELINKQEKKFHALMHVPGYLNSEEKNYDNAAAELAKMLKVQQ